MTAPVLLDTCAAIWLMNGDPMSQASRDAIRQAQTQGAGVYVSPISAWEIATLISRNRLHLTLAPEAWFDHLLSRPGVRLASLSPAILMQSASLPGAPPKDPADRIVAATARALGYALVTRDGELIPYAASGHLDVIAC